MFGKSLGNAVDPFTVLHVHGTDALRWWLLREVPRAGDADYLMNGEVCRLVDVQDALAGRGLGPDALAIVRQGQVEALSTSRPEERRAMIAVAGLAIGAAGAVASARFLESLVVGASRLEAATMFGSALILASVALLAAAVPARRAARVDPMRALREE